MVFTSPKSGPPIRDSGAPCLNAGTRNFFPGSAFPSLVTLSLTVGPRIRISSSDKPASFLKKSMNLSCALDLVVGFATI